MIRERIRAGLESLGGAFTRSTDLSPLTSQWVSGMDLDDFGEVASRRLTDPYAQSVFCFRCVVGIGAMLGKVPWELAEVESDDAVHGDPIEALLLQPSQSATWPWMVLRWVMFTLASGNGDLRVGPVSLSTGLPKWLRPTPPGRLMPYRPNVREEDEDLDGWEYHPPRGGMQILPTDSVIRLQYAPTADPWVGIGPLTVARLAAELNYQGDAHTVSGLKRGGLPRAVMTLKNQTFIPPEQRALIKSEYDQNIGGPRNAGSLLLLTGDIDFKSLGWSAVDMDWLNAQEWGRDEIAVAFDYPASYLNANKSAGLNDGGRQADERRLYDSNLLPLGNRMAEQVTTLVRRLSGGRLYFRFNWKAVEALQPQMSERVSQYVQLVNNGIARNEANERLELDFEDTDDGDVPLVSGALTTLKSVVEAPDMSELLGGLMNPGGPPRPPGKGGGGPGDGDVVDGELVDDTKQLEGPDDQGDDGERLPSDQELERWIRRAAAWESYPTGPEERQRFWRATVWAPIVRLEKAARGRVAKHFQKQRSRMVKALAKKPAKRGIWRPGGKRASEEAIDRALAAYQVGGLAESLWPVAEQSFVQGMKAAQLDMARSRNTKKRRKRASGDALQALIDKQVDDGKITKAEAAGIKTEQELDEALAAKGYGTAATGARFGESIQTLDIPNEYAPNGTQRIKLEYFDPRLRMWTMIDEGVRDAVGASLREGYQQGETLRELKERIGDLMGDVSHSRTRTIARTEVGTMRNGGRVEYMREQGVEVVEWLAEQDERTRESHAACDGVQVRLGETFPNGLTHPCQLGAPASEVCNCRCTLLPIARGAADEVDAGDDEDWIPEAAAQDLVLVRTSRGPPVRAYTRDAAATIEVMARAANVHDGGMIALVPSQADAQRLAVEGGELSEELHVTLFYLGDASAIAGDTRQALLDAVRGVASSFTALQGKAFGVAIFNPTGEKPCVVLNIGGDAVAAFRDALEERIGTPRAEHRPWASHLTLTYDSLGNLDPDWLASRMGPVVFDRVRVAFAGQAIDVPLSESIALRDLAAVCRAHGVPELRGDISLA